MNIFNYDVDIMAIEDAIEFLKSTNKPIVYKKGKYGKKVPVKDIKTKQLNYTKTAKTKQSWCVMTILKYRIMMKSTG